MALQDFLSSSSPENQEAGAAAKMQDNKVIHRTSLERSYNITLIRARLQIYMWLWSALTFVNFNKLRSVFF